LELVELASSYEEAVHKVANSGCGKPLTVVTDARPYGGHIGFDRISEILCAQRPVLLTFGTAWGLSRDFIDSADYVLAPITGPTDYNHLSVRSAAAIVLDRLLGVD
jgi:hypothetical protein